MNSWSNCEDPKNTKRAEHGSRLGVWVWLGSVLIASLVGEAAPAGVRFYSGACDGSAVAMVSETLFAAASDESSVLRLYRVGASGPPVREVPLTGFLAGRRHEPDFEGSARIGDRIYWIGSHSRNEQGEARPDRHVLVATAIQGVGDEATLTPVGMPFRGLVLALAAEPTLASVDWMAGARRGAEAAGGLNIEGMAEGPDGALWIGFRNPVPEGKALLVPLLNPEEVTGATLAKPRFGRMLRLDLGGAGIRDMVRTPTGYLLIAGPAEGGGRHRLFAWSGGDDRPLEVAKAVPKGFPAEGIRVVSGSGGGLEVELFSDDGNLKIEGRRCEDLPANRRRFRSVTAVVP